MSKSCCASGCSADAVLDARFRKALWAALIVNACMFALEIVGGLTSGSVSLLADAVDFGGDAASYGISLAVLSMGLVWRSRAAMVKGLSMTAFGVFIIGKALWSALHGEAPEPLTMGVIGLLALLANTGVALMLYAFRSGDANMRSVWLCSRNDMLGNLAVMLAALGVFGTGSAWPDLLVALIMAGLALSSGLVVVRQARQELAAGAPLSGRGGAHPKHSTARLTALPSDSPEAMHRPVTEPQLLAQSPCPARGLKVNRVLVTREPLTRAAASTASMAGRPGGNHRHLAAPLLARVLQAGSTADWRDWRRQAAPWRRWPPVPRHRAGAP